MQVDARHRRFAISYWGNPDYDTALLLSMAAGTVQGKACRLSLPAQRIQEYIDWHIEADRSHRIGCDVSQYGATCPGCVCQSDLRHRMLSGATVTQLAVDP
jgi:hypothetical protein